MRSPYMKKIIHNPYHKESGAVLVVGLIILGILMMGALAMMQTSVQDERMVSNKRMQTQAFLTAEAGLLAAQYALNDEFAKKSASLCEEIKANNSAATEDKKQLLSMTGYDFSEKDFSGNGVPDVAKAKYTVAIENCTSDPVLTSTASVGGAEVALEAGYQPPTPPGIDLGDPPAPVSCFNGECTIANGAGNGAGIFGRDHVPKAAAFHCKGQKSCGETSISKLTDDVRPAIYQEKGGTVTSKKGQSQICGADNDSPEKMSLSNQVCYSDKSSDLSFGAIWNADDYKGSGHYKNEKGESVAPDSSTFFGESGDDPYAGIDYADDFVVPPSGVTEDEIYDHAKAVIIDGDADLDLEGGVGVLLIEGEGTSVKQTGTGVFVGIVVIRHCASFSIGGNFTVLGAVIVDARKANGDACDQPYSPFAEGGAPTVYFSSSAGKGVSGLLPPGGPGSLTSWQQLTES